MGNNTSSKCSKEPTLCPTDNIKCECPNGIPVSGYCSKKKPYKCAKCLPNYGYKDGKVFGGGKDNDITNKNLNEYSNNVTGFTEDEKTSFGPDIILKKNPNLDNNNYSYFPNMPNSNERCDIIESIKLIRKKNRNLEKLNLNCDEVLKDSFVKKMLNTDDTSPDIAGILKNSLNAGGNITWSDGTENLTNVALYNILNKNESQQNNMKNLLKTYTQCSNTRLDENNKTMKELLRNSSYNSAIGNDNLKRSEYENRRILELNMNNKTFYDNVFDLIKHLIYFGLILFFLIYLKKKDKILFVVFSGLLILLITITLIVVTNDILDIYKNYN